MASVNSPPARKGILPMVVYHWSFRSILPQNATETEENIIRVKRRKICDARFRQETILEFINRENQLLQSKRQECTRYLCL